MNADIKGEGRNSCGLFPGQTKIEFDVVFQCVHLRLKSHVPQPERRYPLAFLSLLSACLEMGLPAEPVTLSVEELDQLNRELANLRHDINNTLSLIMAATELIRYKPHLTERMMTTLIEQPPKILGSLAKFSDEFERTFGITRP